MILLANPNPAIELHLTWALVSNIYDMMVLTNFSYKFLNTIFSPSSYSPGFY